MAKNDSYTFMTEADNLLRLTADAVERLQWKIVEQDEHTIVACTSEAEAAPKERIVATVKTETFSTASVRVQVDGVPRLAFWSANKRAKQLVEQVRELLATDGDRAGHM